MKILLIALLLLASCAAPEPVEYEEEKDRPVSEGSFKKGEKQKVPIAYVVMCAREPDAEGCPDE